MPRLSKPVVEDANGELIIPGAYGLAPGGICERRSTFEWDNNGRALINVDELSVALSDDTEDEEESAPTNNSTTNAMATPSRQEQSRAGAFHGESTRADPFADEEQGLPSLLASQRQPSSTAQQQLEATPQPVEASEAAVGGAQPRTSLASEVFVCGKAKNARATWIRAVSATTLLLLAMGMIVFWQQQKGSSKSISMSQTGTYATEGDMFEPPAPGLAFRSELGLQPIIAKVVVNSSSKLQPSWKSPFFQALYWILYEDSLQMTMQEDGEAAIQQRYLMTAFYFATSGQHPSARRELQQQQQWSRPARYSAWKLCSAPTSLPLVAQAINMNHNTTTAAAVAPNSNNPQVLAQQCTHHVLTQRSPLTLESRPQSWRWLSATHECDWAGVECNDKLQVTSIVLGMLGRPFRVFRVISCKRPNCHQNMSLAHPFSSSPTCAADYGLTDTLIEELGFLDSLHTLSLPYNENLGGQVPINLFGRVRVLDLHHNQHEGNLFAMDDAGETIIVAAMLANSSLEEIHMAGNNISGSLPEALNQLTKLRVLSLEENDLTGTLASFRWPMLEVLRLDQNRLSGSIPVSLVSSSDLSILDLSQNADIVGTIPSEIGAAYNAMTYLGLANCQLDGTVPMELYSLTKLEGIYLQDNNLQGTMASEIGKWSRLEKLNWQNNDFSGTLPTQLGNLNQIIDFLINDNDFEGTVPLQFCDMGTQTFGLAFSANVVADCQPEDSDKDAEEFKALVCPEGCCSSCCQKSTRDCTLDPSAILGLKSGSGLP